MNRRIAFCWPLLAVTVSATNLVSTVRAGEPPEGALALINGGGRAVVTNEEGFLPPGAITEFGVHVWVDDPILGDAGTFVCFVEGGDGGFVADITNASVLPDDTIMLRGASTCVLAPIGLEVFFDEPITICVYGSGPGVGGFDVFFDNAPEFGADEETVISGRINVVIND